MMTSDCRAGACSFRPLGRHRDEQKCASCRTKRGVFPLIAALLVAAIALGIGCGNEDAAAVQSEFAQYLDSRGFSSELEVMDGGCSDAQFEQEGLSLWKCTVYRGNDAETWNVLYDGELVVDASQDR